MSIGELLAGGGGALIILLTLIQVSPIKVNPWSSLVKWFGKNLNTEVVSKVDKLEASITDLTKKQEEAEARTEKRDIDLCRMRILRFADELRRGIDHSEEFFDQVLDDITDYKHYCESHTDYENNKAVAAIQKIERTYQERLDKNDFL